MTYATDIRSIERGIMDRVHAAMTAFADARAQRKVYRDTLNELRAMTPRDLADVGISACEIPFIAREAAYGAK